MKPTPDDSKRLSSNHQALLHAMPEMLMLADLNGVVEYMNQSATFFLKPLISNDGGENIQLQLQNLINTLLLTVGENNYSTGRINNLFFDCKLVPFTGYNGDKLYWLIFRNSVKKENAAGESPARTLTDHKIVGTSRAVKELFTVVDRIARTDTTVLISGESGTGKELVANLIKEKSNRWNKSFLTINCNTISDLLLESEFFGYEKGSFTGANTLRKGKFEIADKGTIFLDEIGDISPRMQAALLRVLQNGEITRVGGHRTIEVDVRIIAATNKDIARAVKQETFRLDLFYRLNIINIVIPPLRERKEDIFELTAYFIQKYNSLFEKSIDLNTDLILKKLEDYDWPGNVRELENVIHRAVLMCKRSYLSTEDIIFDTIPLQNEMVFRSSANTSQDNDQPLKSMFNQVERDALIEKLRSYQGNVVKAAKSLQISKSTFYEKMKQHGIKIKALI